MGNLVDLVIPNKTSIACKCKLVHGRKCMPYSEHSHLLELRKSQVKGLEIESNRIEDGQALSDESAL